MTANHAHTPTVLDEMRTAFAMRHWNLTGDQKEGERLFDEEIARIEAAAEQRGAVKELKQLLHELMEGEFQVGHHAGLHTASTIISDRLIELLVSADQREGDDE